MNLRISRLFLIFVFSSFFNPALHRNSIPITISSTSMSRTGSYKISSTISCRIAGAIYGSEPAMALPSLMAFAPSIFSMRQITRDPSKVISSPASLKIQITLCGSGTMRASTATIREIMTLPIFLSLPQMERKKIPTASCWDLVPTQICGS